MLGSRARMPDLGSIDMNAVRKLTKKELFCIVIYALREIINMLKVLVASQVKTP